MSGHSKWANIKHKKGAADAKRGKVLPVLLKRSQWLQEWVVVTPTEIHDFAVQLPRLDLKICPKTILPEPLKKEPVRLRGRSMMRSSMKDMAPVA